MPQLGELYLAQSHEPNRRWLAVSTNENCWKVVSHYWYALDVICILVFCLQFCNGWMHKFNLSLLKHHLYQLWCTLLVFISQSLLFTLHSWLLQRLFSIPTYPWVEWTVVGYGWCLSRDTHSTLSTAFSTAALCWQSPWIWSFDYVFPLGWFARLLHSYQQK